MTGPASQPQGTVGVLQDLVGLRARRDGDPEATHLALPSAERPRFYVPLLSKRAAAASCLAYNRLRPSAVARRRAVVGWGLRCGMLQRLRGTPMVSDAGSADDRTSGGPTLPEAVAQRLGRPELAFATSPRELDPWWTPTLQLFEADGTPVAYAKVGWTALTRRQVTTESDLLTRLVDEPSPHFVCPRPLARFEWGEAVVSITAPMPAHISRLRGDEGPFPEAMAAVAALDGPPQVEPFGASGAAAALGELIDGPNPGLPEAEWAALGGYWRDSLDAVGSQPVALGRWHGDWVPWNLARVGGDLWVWDWEYSGARRPVGLDALHWHYQRARITDGAELTDALAASRIRSAEVLESLGVDADGERVLATAHALELTLRSLEALVLDAPGARRVATEAITLAEQAAARAAGDPS